MDVQENFSDEARIQLNFFRLWLSRYGYALVLALLLL